MAKFTIKDLAEGKCAVKNDGSVEELNKVLKAAFPIDIKAVGNAAFYRKLRVGHWIGKEIIELPIQSVKDFLEEIEKPKLPKRKDKIMKFNIPTDKLLHLICCYAITLTFGIFAEWIGVVVCLVLALGKEFIWDKWLKKGTFEWQDINYDLIGLICGLCVSIVQHQVFM